MSFTDYMLTVRCLVRLSFPSSPMDSREQKILEVFLVRLGVIWAATPKDLDNL